MSNLPPPSQPNLPPFPREEWTARYKVFRHFAYDDQYAYYLSTITRNRQAGTQVNRLRALMSLITGLASALAGLIVQVSLTAQNGQCFNQSHAGNAAFTQTEMVGNSCTALILLIDVLLILSVVAPAIGGGFNILADLYQWDRLTSIYEGAQRNMKVAYSRVPEEDMPDAEFALSVNLFMTDTLDVMYEEAGQWGQSLHSPAAIASFLSESAKRASDAAGQFGGEAASGDTMVNSAMTASGAATVPVAVSAHFAADPVAAVVPTAPVQFVSEVPADQAANQSAAAQSPAPQPAKPVEPPPVQPPAQPTAVNPPPAQPPAVPQAAKPIAPPADIPAEKPAAPPADQSTSKPADKPADPPASKPAAPPPADDASG